MRVSFLRMTVCVLALLLLLPAAVASAQMSHGGLYDGLGGSGPEVTLRWAEVAVLGLTDEEIGAAWSFGLATGEWTIGYDGFFIEQEPNDGAPTRNTQLHRLSFGFDFLEVYWDTWFTLELGYAFGDRLINDDSFDAVDFGARFGLPIINGPQGFPLVRADASYSFRPLNGFSEHFTFFAALTVYPIPGGPLRPFGITLGFQFGEVEDVAYNAFRIGIIFGGRLPGEHDH